MAGFVDLLKKLLSEQYRKNFFSWSSNLSQAQEIQLDKQITAQLINNLANGKTGASHIVRKKTSQMGPEAAAKFMNNTISSYKTNPVTAEDVENNAKISTLLCTMLHVPMVRDAFIHEANRRKSGKNTKNIMNILGMDTELRSFRAFMGFKDPMIPLVYKTESPSKADTVEKLKMYAKTHGSDPVPFLLRQLASDLHGDESYKTTMDAVFFHAISKENPVWTLDQLQAQIGTTLMVNTLFGEEKEKFNTGKMDPSSRANLMDRVGEYKPEGIIKLIAGWMETEPTDRNPHDFIETIVENPKVLKWVRSNEIEKMFPDAIAKRLRGVEKKISVQHDVARMLGLFEKGDVTSKEMDQRLAKVATDPVVKGAGTLRILEVLNDLHAKFGGNRQPFAQAYVRCMETLQGTRQYMSAQFTFAEELKQMKALVRAAPVDIREQKTPHHAAQARISLAKTKGPGGR